MLPDSFRRRFASFSPLSLRDSLAFIIFTDSAAAFSHYFAGADISPFIAAAMPPTLRSAASLISQITPIAQIYARLADIAGCRY
jgi:hypothetical protein